MGRGEERAWEGGGGCILQGEPLPLREMTCHFYVTCVSMQSCKAEKLHVCVENAVATKDIHVHVYT